MTVLIVSSGSEIVRMLGALLSPDGMDVEACVTLYDARRLPVAFRIDGVVVDAEQVDGDGVTWLSEARATGRVGPTVPAVVVSAKVDEAMRRRAESLGAKVFSKPPSLLDVADILRRAMPATGGDGPEVTIAASDDDEPPMYFLPGPEPGPPDPPFRPAPLRDLMRAAELPRMDVAPPAPRFDAPRVEAPCADPPRVEPPRAEPPRAEPPRVERPRAEPPRAEPPRARRMWNAENARALTRLWARRATGVLRVETPNNSAWVLFAHGGPVGPDGVAAADEALGGGEVSLDPCEVEESGDRVALARILWRAAQEAASGDAALGLVPAANSLTEAADDMTLTPATRRCIARLESGLTVQALARREGAPVADVALDLAALGWLGLVALREPEPVAPPRTFGPPLSEPVQERRRGAPPMEEPVADPASVTRREVIRPATGPARAERPFGDALPPRPKSPAAAPGSTEAVDDPATSATSSMMPVARLRREVDVLRTADAWTVLGIARRAAPEMIVSAALRMKHRYRAMDKDPNRESRELAAEILTRIEAAERELVSGKVSTEEPVFAGLLRSGIAAIGSCDWARADRLLAQARQHAPDDSIGLAHLGWARFNNPEQPKEAREDDGADLVELALQFDINCALAWGYRGEIATARGDREEARACFSTALKLDPSMLVAKAR